METYAEAAQRLLAKIEERSREKASGGLYRPGKFLNAHRRAHGEAGSVLESSFPLRSPLVLKADNDNCRLHVIPS
ncbi:hypothetical protein KUV24_01390 [Nitratireductor sp. DP7N14-4]|nr:hypothetical protein [Nitratireductor sp. DP7N14-4]